MAIVIAGLLPAPIYNTAELSLKATKLDAGSNRMMLTVVKWDVDPLTQAVTEACVKTLSWTDGTGCQGEKDTVAVTGWTDENGEFDVSCNFLYVETL